MSLGKDSRDVNKILILGHGGFIGNRLINVLVKKLPDKEIIGKSLPELDLANEKEVIHYLGPLFDHKMMVIMCSFIKKQYGDSLDIFKKNIKMMINICNLLQEKPVRRFVYFSSAEVYGHEISNNNITEETPVNPTSYYGIAKYTSECLLRQIAGTQKISLLILRPPLVYGPGDVSRGYGPSGFIWRAINGEKITLWGEGEEKRDFVFIDDVIRIVNFLIFHEFDGIINIASGRSYSFKDIIDIVAEVSEVKLHIDMIGRTKPKVDHNFCNDMLTDLLPNDFSFTSLESGIKKTFEIESQF